MCVLSKIMQLNILPQDHHKVVSHLLTQWYTKTGQQIRAEEFTDELTTNAVSSGGTRSEDRLFSWFTFASSTQLAQCTHAAGFKLLLSAYSLLPTLFQPSSTPVIPVRCFWLNRCHAVVTDACSVGPPAASLAASGLPYTYRKGRNESCSCFMLSTYARGRAGRSWNVPPNLDQCNQYNYNCKKNTLFSCVSTCEQDLYVLVCTSTAASKNCRLFLLFLK